MTFLNPIQDWTFRTAHGWRGKKVPPPEHLWHISYNDGTWYSYTLPKEDLKIIWIKLHTPWVLPTSAYFHRRLAILQYQEIQIYAVFWYIISNSFFELVKIVLIKMITILMMSAKIATLGLLKIKVFWKKGYDAHNFYPWRHQQKFITWLKLYC